MKLKPFRNTINTEEEYEKALAVLSALVDKSDKTTAKEIVCLKRLGALLEDYEHRHVPGV